MKRLLSLALALILLFGCAAVRAEEGLSLDELMVEIEEFDPEAEEELKWWKVPVSVPEINQYGIAISDLDSDVFSRYLTTAVIVRAFCRDYGLDLAKQQLVVYGYRYQSKWNVIILDITADNVYQAMWEKGGETALTYVNEVSVESFCSNNSLITAKNRFDDETLQGYYHALDLGVDIRTETILWKDLDVSALQRYNLTFSELGTTERLTRLPTAALWLALCDARGVDVDRQNYTAYGAAVNSSKSWFVTVIDHAQGRVYTGSWVCGSAKVTMSLFSTDLNGYLAEYQSALNRMARMSHGDLKPYYEELRNPAPAPFTVGKVTFLISSDKQHIYLTKPSVSGGSGAYTIAYNIYDSNSNPVNYFYSDEENVAATPGYGGLFNVFVVVTDTGSRESDTQNIGWQTLSWPYADVLTVGRAAFEVSPDRKSVFLTRPAIACRGGSVTVAYNIYDADSNPVNYFYSADTRVAATPGYAGRFNVFIVVTDTVTGEQNNQDIGWVELK
ncbi:MAG: hypothetical protein IKP40_09580 [Clostridia bacterium]|nr:hypothetical protein [Clostridia bacterium]